MARATDTTSNRGAKPRTAGGGLEAGRAAGAGLAEAASGAGPEAAGAGPEVTEAALRFAGRAHLGQHRKQDHAPYLEHPVAVAELLAGAGADETLIAAAYLHDVTEKTEVGGDEIRARFGVEVAGLVEALSEDPEIGGYAARKRALRRRVLGSDRGAVLIYAADRVANLRDWVAVPAAERGAIAARLETTLEERLQLWSEDLDELTAYDPELPFLTEIEVALGQLRAGARF